MNNKNNVPLGDGLADEFNDVINNELKKMINEKTNPPAMLGRIV